MYPAVEPYQTGMATSVYLALCLFTGLVSSVIAWLAWRRNTPGSRGLAILMTALVIWSLTYAAHWAAKTPQVQMFWLDATYFGVLVVPTAFFIFAIQYTGRERWLTSKNAVLLSIEPLTTLIILWTDPWHGLFYAGQRSSNAILDGGPMFWFNLVYSFGLILAAIFLVAKMYLQSQSIYRDQALAILTAALIPFTGILLGLFGLSPLPGLDITPFLFGVSGLVFANSLYRQHLLDLAPIARDVLMESMQDGLLVIDERNRIVDVNPAARLMLGDEKTRIGSLLEDSLPIWSEETHRLDEVKDESRVELRLAGNQNRYAELIVTKLQDGYGRLVGRLLVFRDVTERKLAEETDRKQRALAEALRGTFAALNSTLVLEEVLDRILVNVGCVVPHDAASFVQIETGQMHLERTTEKTREEPDEEKNSNLGPFQWSQNPMISQMVKVGKALAVSTTSESMEWIGSPDSLSIQSYVGAPVVVKGSLVGIINLGSVRPGFYTMEHADHLQTFADQAAVAIENARLFNQTTHRAEQLATLNRLGLVITSDLEMKHVQRSIYEQCCNVADVDVFYLAICDEMTGLIEFPTFYDQDIPVEFGPFDLNKDSGLTGYVIKTRRSLYIPDTKSPDIEQNYPIIRTGGVPSLSYIGVPILLRDRILGVISMQNYNTYAYTEEDIHLLETISTQAAVAIENARLYAEVQRLAIVDELTNVYNYRGLMEMGPREVERAHRFGRPLSALFFDIDHFREFNNEYGHIIGNQVLHAVAECAQRSLRAVNLLVRYGGEEFVVLLPETTLEQARATADRLRSNVELLRVSTEKGSLGVTISIGVAQLTGQTPTLEVLIENANQAERLAKENGRNRIEVH
jgi:diguanylate cyclase (GGDEF)-like protein/PAS domain S-box-containing protein